MTFNSSADADVFIRLTNNATGTTPRNFTFQADSGDASLIVESGATGNYVIGSGGEYGNVDLSSNLVINHNGSGTLSINRPIRNAFRLTKNGTGTLVFNGANSFTGGLTLNEGMLVLGNDSALGDPQNIITFSGGTIDVTAARSTTNNNAQNWNGNFAFAGSHTLNLGTGAVTLGGNISIDVQASTLTVGGVIGDAGNTRGLTKNGSGTLVLSGVQNYTGLTTVNTGTLALGGNLTLRAITGSGNLSLSTFTLTTNTSSNTTYSGVISGSGALTKNGSGTLVLSGANTYSGNTTISAGILNIQNAEALGTTLNGTTVSSGAALQLQGGISVGTEALSLNGAGLSTDGALRNIADNNSYGGNITLAGATRINSDAGLLTLTGGISGAQSLTIGGAGNITISNVIATSTGTLTKDGSGTLVLSGSNTYTGSTTINQGVLSIDNLANGGIGASTNAAANLVLGGGTLRYTRSTSSTDRNFTLANGTASAIDVTEVGTVLTISGTTPTSSGAASSLEKLGAGTLALGSNLRITGGLTIQSGTLTASAAGAMGTSSNTVFFGSSGQGTLNLQAAATTFAALLNASTGNGTILINPASSGAGVTHTIGLATFGGDRMLTVQGGANVSSGTAQLTTGAVTLVGNATLRVLDPVASGASTVLSLPGTSGSGNLTLANDGSTINGIVLSGTANHTGSIINSGTGSGALSITTGIGSNVTGVVQNSTTSALTLSANNTPFAGGVTLQSGTLILGNNAALGTGTFTINGGTLDVTAVRTTTNNNAQNWNNNFAFVGSNTLNLGTGAVTLGGNIALDVQGSTLTVGGVIGDGGFGYGLTKNGAGNLTLSGESTYNGTTTLNAGTLSLGADDVIGDSSAVSVNGGTLNLGAQAETFHSLNVSGGEVLRGGGTLALSNASSITGGNVTLTAGASRINTSGLLTLGNASLNYTSSAANNNALVLGGNIQVNDSSTFRFLDSGGNATNDPRLNLGNADRVFDVASGANLDIGWVVSNGALTKNGTGTLTFSAENANLYTGATTINAGTLVLNNTNTGSAIAINSGGTLSGTGSGGATIVAAGGRISPGGSSVGTLATTTLTLNGTGGYIWNITDATGGAGTGWDLINVGGGAGAATINANSGSKFTIFVNGNAPSNFTNTDSYTWNIIDWGTATGFSADAFDVNTSGFTGADPAATWTLANNSGFLQLLYTYATGTPVYSIGTGTWSGNFTPALTNTSDAIFAGAGGTATNNIPSATINTLGTITFNSTAGAYTLAADSGSAGHSATPLTLTGSIVNNSTANQTVNLAMKFDSTRVVDTASGNISIGGVIEGGGLTKNGSSILTLTADNTLTGAIQINAGTLATSGSGGFANTANITVASGATYDVGVTDQINSLTSPGNLTLSAGTLTISSSANSSISGAISGSGNLTKAGSGTLTILSNNTGYSGVTRLEGGELQIGNNGALGSGNITLAGSGITIRSTDATDLTISNRIGGFAGGMNALYNFGSSGTGNITFSNSQSANLGASRIFSINNAITHFDGVFSGAASDGITKNGTGTMILTGNNTYGGTTTINAGILQIGAGGTSGSIASAAVVNNAALVVDRSGTITLSANMSGSGSLTKNGNGTLVLSGSNSYSGVTTINAGNLTISGGNAIADNGTVILANTAGVNFNVDASETIGSLQGGGAAGGTVNIASSHTLTVNQTSNQIFAGVIAGSGGFTKTGANTLTLSGNNTYTGTTTISAGTLQLGAGGATGSIASAAIVNNAALVVDRTGTITLSGNMSGSGTLTKNGSGTLILSGSNTYSGATVVNSGTLNANHANALGNTANVTVNGGSLLVGMVDAINDKTIFLNKTISGNASAAQAALAFDTAYTNTSSTAGSLTLNQDSIIDLGTGGVVVHFAEIANLNSYILHVFNWEGDSLWSGSPGGGKDQFYVDQSLDATELSNIRFYSGLTQSSFLSTGFQLGLGSGFQNEIIAVPEPKTWATGILLLFVGAWWLWRTQKRTTMQGIRPADP